MLVFRKHRIFSVNVHALHWKGKRQPLWLRVGGWVSYTLRFYVSRSGTWTSGFSSFGIFIRFPRDVCWFSLGRKDKKTQWFKQLTGRWGITVRMSEFEFIKSWYYYSIIAEELLVSMRVFRTQGEIHLRWISNCIFYLSEERELIQNFASVLSIGGVDTVSSTGSDGARRSRYAPQRSPSASVNFKLRLLVSWSNRAFC